MFYVGVVVILAVAVPVALVGTAYGIAFARHVRSSIAQGLGQRTGRFETVGSFLMVASFGGLLLARATGQNEVAMGIIVGFVAGTLVTVVAWKTLVGSSS